MTMQATLSAPRLFGNTSSELPPDIRRAIMTLYHAHWNDARIATELQIPLATVARFRAARFLAAK